MKLLGQMRNASWFWYSMICVLCWALGRFSPNLAHKRSPQTRCSFYSR